MRRRSSSGGRAVQCGGARLLSCRSAAFNRAWRSSTAPIGVRIRKRPESLKGGSAAERDDREALGRSRGGYGTKAYVIADRAGRGIAFRNAPGQAPELLHALPLLDRRPGGPRWIVADQGYSIIASVSRSRTPEQNPAIPTQRNEPPVRFPDWIDNNRNIVERLWVRLKEWRAVATRYEKTAASFSGVLSLAVALNRLK